jgi:hypothetical protein
MLIYEKLFLRKLIAVLIDQLKILLDGLKKITLILNGIKLNK